MKDSRDEWNQGIVQTVVSLSADLVVSAGFMRILPSDFVNRFPTINSGTTVHWVDDGVDTGPVITQMEVPVLPGDDEATLHERIKKVERGLIVATIALILPTLERNV
jgi:phosphoribosylglycinamide formyltransferase-1